MLRMSATFIKRIWYGMVVLMKLLQSRFVDEIR